MSAQNSHAEFGRTAPVREAVAPLSLRLWDLDWSELLPWKLEDGVSVERGTFEQALPFMKEHYGEVFGLKESAFLVEPMTDAKRRFLSEADVFLFREEGTTFGIFIGHPSDWSTYYMRTTAFTEAYRGRGFFKSFVASLLKVLGAAGVTRVEAEVSTVNRRVLGLLSELEFVTTALETSERWGAVSRLTHFFKAESNDVFRKQFCAMPTRATDCSPRERSPS